MDKPKKARAQRVTVNLKVNLKLATKEEFAERFAQNISRTGIFVRATDPVPIGSRVKFEYRLADSSRVLRGMGVVRWVRTPEQAHEAGEPAGMGIEFVDVDAETDELITQVVAQFGEGARAPRRARAVTSPSAVVADHAPAAPSLDRKLDQEEASALDALLGGAPSAVAEGPPQEPGDEVEIPIDEDGAGVEVPIDLGSESPVDEDGAGVVVPIDEDAADLDIPLDEDPADGEIPLDEAAADDDLEIPLHEAAANVETPVDVAAADVEIPLDEAAADDDVEISLDEAAADVEIPLDEAEANVEIPLDEAAANVEIPLHEAEANVEIPLDEAAADVEIPLDEAEANVEIPLDEAAANVEIPLDEAEANVEIPLDEAEANVEIPLDEAEANVEIPLDEAEANVEIPLDEAAADVEIPTDARATDEAIEIPLAADTEGPKPSSTQSRPQPSTSADVNSLLAGLGLDDLEATPTPGSAGTPHPTAATPPAAQSDTAVAAAPVASASKAEQPDLNGLWIDLSSDPILCTVVEEGAVVTHRQVELAASVRIPHPLSWFDSRWPHARARVMARRLGLHLVEQASEPTFRAPNNSEVVLSGALGELLEGLIDELGADRPLHVIAPHHAPGREALKNILLVAGAMEPHIAPDTPRAAAAGIALHIHAGSYETRLTLHENGTYRHSLLLPDAHGVEADRLLVDAAARALSRDHGIDVDDDPTLLDDVRQQVVNARRAEHDTWEVSIAGAPVELELESLVRCTAVPSERIALACEDLLSTCGVQPSQLAAITITASDVPWPGLVSTLQQHLGHAPEVISSGAWSSLTVAAGVQPPSSLDQPNPDPSSLAAEAPERA